MFRGRRKASTVEEAFERKKKDYEKRLMNGGLDEILRYYLTLTPEEKIRFLELIKEHRKARYDEYLKQALEEVSENS